MTQKVTLSDIASHRDLAASRSGQLVFRALLVDSRAERRHFVLLKQKRDHALVVEMLGTWMKVLIAVPKVGEYRIRLAWQAQMRKRSSADPPVSPKCKYPVFNAHSCISRSHRNEKVSCSPYRQVQWPPVPR